MNKNLKLIVLLVALIALSMLSYFLMKDDSTVLSNKALSDFSVEDTASVDRLELSNTADQNITLVRNNNTWVEENGMSIDQQMVHTILKTIKRIQVKSPVPEPSQETVIDQIIGSHVKMNIYQKGELLKTYYIGHPTKDHYGTYMLLETPSEGRSPEPFIMYLPGHPGHLTTRFVANPDAWKFSGILNLNPLSIEEVQFENYLEPQKSFTIQALAKNEFKLLDQFEKNTFSFDTVRVRDYLTRYRKVHYDFVENNLTKEMQDSILSSKPFARLKVVSKNGDSKSVECFRRPPRKEEYDLDGNQVPFDRDLFIGYVDQKELVVCQYYVFDKLFMDYAAFLKPQPTP